MILQNHRPWRVFSLPGQNISRRRGIPVKKGRDFTPQDASETSRVVIINETVLGTVIGGVTALVLARVLTTMLYHVSATDPLTFGGVAMLLACVALLASYLPARKATQIDPNKALRYE